MHRLLATKEQLQFWGSGRSSPKRGIKTLCSTVTQEAEPATLPGHRSCATSHPSVPLFQGRSANPQRSSYVPNRIIPPQQHGEAEGSAAGLPAEQNTSTVPPKDSPRLKDEQPRMAKQTDGGRRREAHDTGETVVISVISSNHSSTAAFPLLSVCSAHQCKPTAKEDFDTPCTLNITAMRKFGLDWSFLSRCNAEGSSLPALPAPAHLSKQHPVLQKGHETRLGFGVD